MAEIFKLNQPVRNFCMATPLLSEANAPTAVEDPPTDWPQPSQIYPVEASIEHCCFINRET